MHPRDQAALEIAEKEVARVEAEFAELTQMHQKVEASLNRLRDERASVSKNLSSAVREGDIDTVTALLSRKNAIDFIDDEVAFEGKRLRERISATLQIKQRAKERVIAILEASQ